jgi:hypothetical protein
MNAFGPESCTLNLRACFHLILQSSGTAPQVVLDACKQPSRAAVLACFFTAFCLMLTSLQRVIVHARLTANVVQLKVFQPHPTPSILILILSDSYAASSCLNASHHIFASAENSINSHLQKHSRTSPDVHCRSFERVG